MTVIKQNPNPGKKKKVVAAKKKATTIKKHSTLALPIAPKEIDDDPSNYLTLLYGVPKIGKTILASSYPQAIFFATEPGVRGLSIYSLNEKGGGVRDWSIFRKGVELLLSSRSDFKTVVIDTVDRAYDMCLDWICQSKGIEYPGQDAFGREDHGKSWRAVKVEFTKQVHALVQAGYGLVFISHAKDVEVKSRSGEKYNKIITTMSAQATSVIESLSDFIFYLEYMKLSGVSERVMICQGDELVRAGARATPGGTFPQFLPLKEEGGYEIIKQAFRGEYQGIDPALMQASKGTTKAGGEFLDRQRAKKLVSTVRSKKGGAVKRKVR